MNKAKRYICVILVLSFIMAIPVSAQSGIEQRESAFFAAHDTYLEKTTETKFRVWYDVTATGIMQKLGVSKIEVDHSPDGQNWELVATYEMGYYPAFVRSNTATHSGYLTYHGATPGYYYRAYVTFYAKNSSGTAKLSRMTTTLRM